MVHPELSVVSSVQAASVTRPVHLKKISIVEDSHHGQSRQCNDHLSGWW